MIKMEYDNSLQQGDLVLDDDGAFVNDQTWETSTSISLLSNARSEDTSLPNAERSGWWADETFDGPPPQLGSRLWEMLRTKTTNEVLSRAENIVKEGLNWMVVDRIADKIEVEAARIRRGQPIRGQVSGTTGDVLRLTIQIFSPSDPKNPWVTTWELHADAS